MVGDTSRLLLNDLYGGLAKRPLPETVAQALRGLLPDLTEDELRALPVRKHWYAGGMAADWNAVVGIDTGLLTELLGVPMSDSGDPASIRAALEYARPLLAMVPGKSDFKHDRLNREERAKAGVELSRRRYDKLFRVISRIESEVEDLAEQLVLANLARYAKVGMAPEVPYAAFAANVNSAAFVAYYAANMGRRSLFTVGKQARAMDTGAALLLKRCEADPNANWYAVAHVFPREEVLARLTPDQLGDLLTAAARRLSDCAERLEKIYRAAPPGTLNIAAMVVKRGNDSSTWNALAGAWNKARDLWISVSWAMGGDLLEGFLPGKTLRLMAGDVAAWHRSAGGGLDPDTAVWADLPKPWQVFSGERTSTRQDVWDACTRHGVNPATSGWGAPRPRTAVDATRMTPETVHGVVVERPELVALLRRAGWFSGYAARVRQVGVPDESHGEILTAHAEYVGAPATLGSERVQSE